MHPHQPHHATGGHQPHSPGHPHHATGGHHPHSPGHPHQATGGPHSPGTWQGHHHHGGGGGGLPATGLPATGLPESWQDHMAAHFSQAARDDIDAVLARCGETDWSLSCQVVGGRLMLHGYVASYHQSHGKYYQTPVRIELAPQAPPAVFLAPPPPKGPGQKYFCVSRAYSLSAQNPRVVESTMQLFTDFTDAWTPASRLIQLLEVLKGTFAATAPLHEVQAQESTSARSLASTSTALFATSSRHAWSGGAGPTPLSPFAASQSFPHQHSATSAGGFSPGATTGYVNLAGTGPQYPQAGLPPAGYPPYPAQYPTPSTGYPQFPTPSAGFPQYPLSSTGQYPPSSTGYPVFHLPGSSSRNLMGGGGGAPPLQPPPPPPPPPPRPEPEEQLLSLIQQQNRNAVRALTSACSNFAEANVIGRGSSGKVYRGTLDGTPVAVKCLAVPSAAARQAVAREFQAELIVLSNFRHSRVVRLITSAIDESPTAPYAFLLCFELLEEGSLADHLRGAAGQPPQRKPALTPLERVDIALGVAAGLAYLHGLRVEEGEQGVLVTAAPAQGGSSSSSSGGGAAGGAGGGSAAASAVLHRDIKAANVGLTRKAGGVFSKLMDCGLARAPKEGGTTTVVGTLGYMAPELVEGAYSPLSDIYAFGCLLLELLTGQQLQRDTARTLEGKGLGAVQAAAEACWPAPARAALAALLLACIRSAREARPGSMVEVLPPLRALRQLVAPQAPPLFACAVCMDDFPEAGGLRCRAPAPAPAHFTCHPCLAAHVRSSFDRAKMAQYKGKVPCVDAACKAAPWDTDCLPFQRALDRETLMVCFKAVKWAMYDEEEARLATERRLQAAVEAAKGNAEKLRVAIVERDLYLRCPRCKTPFVDYDGCNSLTCGTCPCVFCAICLKDCQGDAHKCATSHSPTRDVFDKPLFEAERRKTFLTRVTASITEQAKGGAALQKAIVLAMAADLATFNITKEEVLAAAGVK